MNRRTIGLALVLSQLIWTPALADVTVSTYCSKNPHATGVGTGRTYSIAAQIAVAKCVSNGGSRSSCMANVAEVKQ